jgi:hypothetical protein
VFPLKSSKKTSVQPKAAAFGCCGRIERAPRAKAENAMAASNARVAFMDFLLGRRL